MKIGHIQNDEVGTFIIDRMLGGGKWFWLCGREPTSQ